MAGNAPAKDRPVPSHRDPPHLRKLPDTDCVNHSAAGLASSAAGAAAVNPT
jgi:hypothetical protein